MKLEVIRFSSQERDTLGLLFDASNGTEFREFLCFTLEDEDREEKVMHETRIPAGTYNLRLKTWGGYHDRYTKRFGEMHKGMIEVLDVPNFKHILIHCGNDEDDTSGCLLLGNSQTQNVTATGYVSGSTEAYKRVYPLIAEALQCEDCTITYTDYDG